jgi:alcohol dehydrogenase class IV
MKAWTRSTFRPAVDLHPDDGGAAADVSQFAIIRDSASMVKKAIISKKVVPDLALIDPVPLLTMDAYLTAARGWTP